MSLRDLAKRLAVAALGVPLTLVLIFFGGWALTLGLAFIAALATREFFSLGEAQGIRGFPLIGISGAVALILVAGMARGFEGGAPWAFGILLGVFLTSAGTSVWLRWPDGRPLTATTLTLAGALYTGGPLSFAIFLRHLPDLQGGFSYGLPWPGPVLLAFPLAVTWIGDSAAYFFGTLMGDRKLIPSVSPGKTVVGGVAGLGTSVLVGVAVGWLALGLHPDPGLSALLGGGIGLLLGVAAPIGDLVESVFKREVGVKDSGAIFPGHGGMLDRFDATIYTLPLAYALVRLAGVLQ